MCRRNLASREPALVADLDRLTTKLEMVATLTTQLDIRLEAKDVPILGGAVAGHATHLLTGDERDFGPYFGRTIQGVKIVSPHRLADELVRRGRLARDR
jgi:predicted nucleic acid-binding protein